MGNGAPIALNPLNSFDTLSLAKRLIKAGIPDNQAEVFAEVQKEQFDSIKATLATKAELTATKEDLKKEIALVRKDIKEMELRLTNNLTVRLGLMLAAGIGIIATLVKL
jgi:hypothetical protein